MAVLVDTNVVIDVITDDPTWAELRLFDGRSGSLMRTNLKI